jgi:epoxyqueuosine reductase
MNPTADWSALKHALIEHARQLGFAAVGVSAIELAEDEARLWQWLERGWHGEMDYMARHGSKRSRPAELVPGTLRVISARMDYWPGESLPPLALLADRSRAYLSRYALGRDYHKVLRQRLQKLADWLTEQVGPFGFRAFTDSAPVLEKPLARNAGLGWIGKHTNLIDRRAGSWFFLGELYIDLPLPVDHAPTDHCGSCDRCQRACPTQAIVAPYQLDARRCISYLTIELQGAIPLELRPLIGNRVFGCDDCQLVCPWNRYAKVTELPDFSVRAGLDGPTLTELFGWDETRFLRRTEGSAIRRLGHVRWLRNLAVGLGNSGPGQAQRQALLSRVSDPSGLVREHVHWALEQQQRAPVQAPGALDLPPVAVPSASPAERTDGRSQSR